MLKMFRDMLAASSQVPQEIANANVGKSPLKSFLEQIFK